MPIESATYISDLVNTNPVGTDDRSTADDHMRLIKAVLKTTFPNASAAITPSVAEFNKLDGLTATTTELNKIDGYTGGSTELNRLNSIAGNGALDAFPTATLMTFQQTAAPTGWVKETTHDNKAFRVVTGAAGSAGTSPFTTVFGLQATDGYALQEADTPLHDHGNGGDHVHTITFVSGSSNSNAGWNINTATGKASGGTTSQYFQTTGAHTHNTFGQGSPNAHSHNIEMRVQYVDLIIARKS